MAQALPTFEEWKEQKRADEDRKYRAYEDNYRAFRAGEAIDPDLFGTDGFTMDGFSGWQNWRARNADRLDVEYTVKALDQELVDTVRDQYKSQWGSKYYYDPFDPEDAARAAGGHMPKYLDRTYDLDNPYDQWLYEHDLPSRDDFSDMYSQAAYDRQERWTENVSLLKGIEKDWNTAYDQREALQNAYNAALDKKAQQSGRAPTQLEREELAQDLLTSGQYDGIAAAYSLQLPDQQEDDSLDAYVQRLEQPDTSAYDAMITALQDGTEVDDSFFDTYRKSDYEKWFAGQIAFTQQDLDNRYEQYLTDKQQDALKEQFRPVQEAASKEVQRVNEKYAALDEEKDFASKSVQSDEVLAALDDPYQQAMYRAVNRIMDEDYHSEVYGNYARVAEGEPIMLSMWIHEGLTDEERARYNYLVATEGGAAGEQYIKDLKPQLQRRYAEVTDERQDATEREAQRINEKYAALDEEKDFESKSVQSDEVLAALDDPYQQAMYRAVNRIMDEGYHSEVYGNYARVAEGEPIMLSMWIHEGLTDEERARYNYLVATEGGAAGEQYIKDLKPQLQRRYAEVTDERQRQTAKELPVLSSLASVYMQFPAAVEGAVALAGTLGDEDYVADHPELFAGTRFIQNARESVAEGMSPTGQFFYQTGMSILDNAARLPLGHAGLGAMGGTVLSSTVNDYVAEGYSGGDALMLGVGSAAIEVLTEKISLDNLMSILRGGATRLSRGALQQAVKEAFRQSIYEGSEEMASEILNYFWESAVLDDGEYDMAVTRYETMGLTHGQAIAQALKDKLPDVLLAGAGGFLSGLVMGGGSSLIAETRSDAAAGSGFGGSAVQRAQAGREIRLAYQEAVRRDGRVLGEEAAGQLKADLQALGVSQQAARTVLQGMDMPNAWASDGLRTAMESVYETARSEAAKVEARAARTEAAELKSGQRLSALMEKFTTAQEKANAARTQGDLKGYLAAVEDMRGAVSNYQNALAVEEKAGEARQIETQEQTRKATAATERAVADAQPAVQEGYARVAEEIANQRVAMAEQGDVQQVAGQAQNAAGQAEAGQMAAGTFAPDPALPNSGFPVSIAQYDDDTKRQIVRAFAAYEMSGVDTADRIILGVVPEQLATDVERIAQIDIHGFDNVLQADGLRHGAKHDGRTGNKPVTPEDVAALLDIFDTYNNITVTSKRGETSIKLSKTGADGMTYVAVIGKKKGHIFTKNMWKGQTKGDGSFRRTDAHNAPASTPAAAANYEPSTDSLPENVQDGKGTTGFLPSTADATGRPQAQAREPMRANRADAAATPQGTAGVDVMDELVRGAGAVGAQETDGAGARAQSAMEAALAGTEEPGARPAGQGKRRYRTGVNRVDTAGRLSASDRMQLRVLDGLGKKYGVKLVIEDTIRYEDGEGRVYAGTANAYYDRSDGTIHVALDAEGGAYLFFAVHELTHRLRAENADAYAALEAFVLNRLEASELYGALAQGEGGTLEERIASVQALYAARGQELSRGEAIEEIVCDAIPVILTDEQTVRELVRTDRTLAERIRDFFEEFYNELMRQLAGVVYGPGNRVEAAALMNDAETVRELAELFKTALESSADLQYELLTQSGSAIEEAGNDKRRGRRLSARADGEDAITMEDVAAIQSIGRKSVNAFSSDEIRTAEPFARRYWRELGVKSPFFRAWFGDWRANDRMPVQLVRVAGADAPKSGRAINADTGRPISWGDRLRSETWAHGTKNALESIKGIDRIIETAVLLDTIAANQTGKSKLPGTAFMHSLYSLVDDGNGLTLYRLFAEEAVPVGGGDPFTRAYELKEIKKVATAPYGVLSVSGGLTNGAPATTYTVADLFAFVKENVPDFQPKPVHPAMLNADGTPRAVRQGVDAAVEVLDGKTALQDGEAVYVKLENPYPAGTAAEVPGRAALEAGGYDGAVYQDGNGGTHYAVLDGTQLKSATDNAGTFDGRNPNLRFSQKADAGWAAYVSEEAQQRYAQDGRFQRWAHRDLAFISAASWDGVHIPADVLMQNPKIREAQELTEGRGSSLQKNLPGTNSLVDERRERLAQRLLNAEHGSAVFENGKIKKINGVEQFTGEVEQGRHACIVIGRPAGGKSRVFANPLSNRYKARILDADTVKPWLDGFDDGYGAGYVQDESSLIMEMAFEKAIARGDNVIIPKIGGGRIVDLANRMKSAGYTVDLYYNEVSEETSIMRAASRFAEEGRYLSLNYLLTIRNKPKETFTKWAESGIFNYAEWRNNDVGFGEEPRLVWRTGDGGLASVLGDAAELERTVGMGSSDAQRYRRDIPVSGGTEAGDREISGQVTGRKQIDSDTTEAPEEGAFFDALIQDTPRRYSARATTNDGAHRQSAEERDAAPAVSEKVLGNVAKRILQRTGSGYSAAQLTDGLKTLLHADAEQRRETADALARQVLAESRERDDRMYDRTLEARAYFRRGKFRLNETQKAEMAYRYNSYGNYRKSLMGKLNLVNSGGSYLDSVWGEICELFPEYFSPDTSEGDQPQKLKEFLDMAYARPEVNPYEQFHGMEDATAALADELVEMVENIGRRPAPERYLEDGRDAEAWEAYWSEVKAGAKGRPAVQRPATRSERLRRAWELFDNGMTPVQYWRQSREEARQASELRLFDDGQPAADTFDTKTSNLLRGLMLRGGERVGGALPDDELWHVTEIFSRARPRTAAGLSLSAPVRVFEDVTGWRGDTAEERAQNIKDGNYLKNTYYEYGNIQAANREAWIAGKMRPVLEAVQQNGVYGALESAVTQMLGEEIITEDQAELAVSDGKTMIVETHNGGVVVLDGRARLLYASDGKTTITYTEEFRERVRRAVGKRSLKALMPVSKTEEGGLRIVRDGATVSVQTADGRVVARVENGTHANMPAVKATVAALQQFYADVYNEIAAALVENGYAPPGYIEHYFPHQPRTYDGIEGFVEALTANDLPTGINGMTGTFSPGQPWNANLQKRLGTYTEFDAIRGFNRYVRGAADTIFYTPVIQRLRQLEKALRQQGTDALTAEDARRNSAYVDWLHEYANEYANKKSSFDRGVESLLGREGYSVSGMLTSLVSQSSVGGNLSSAVSNLIGGLTGLAQVDAKHALREGLRTTWQLLRRLDKRGGYDGFAEQIPFMQRRFSENEDILLTKAEQFKRAGSKALYALFSELDRWAVESVARAKYAECIDAGMTKAQAIGETNDLLIKNFADRGKGQAPRIFRVGWLKPVVQFQLEVLNQMHHFRDMDRAEVEAKLYELERTYGQDIPWSELEKKALSGGGLRKLKKEMAYLVLLYFWGLLTRAIMGRDQTWNPLGMAEDAVRDFREGGVEQAGEGILETIMDNVPFVSVLSGGGRVPVVSNLANVTKAIEALFFDRDFANADLVQAGTSFLPGGGQLRKAIQGAQANAAGGKYTKDGRLQYPISEDDFWKTLLFGPSAAAPEGYDWTDALTKKETEAYRALTEKGYDPDDLYDTLLGYGGSTNAEKALSLLANRGEWNDGELNMIAELLGLNAGGSLERYAQQETDRYLSEKRKELARGALTQQDYDQIEARLAEYWEDVHPGA